jgi:hypothetical protein
MFEVDSVQQSSPVVTGGQELAMDPILGPLLALMAALKPAVGATVRTSRNSRTLWVNQRTIRRRHTADERRIHA